MAREIVILWAGRHQRRAWETLCEHYRQRIRRFMPLRELPVKVKGAADGVERRRAEGRALVAALPDPGWTVALDERGKERTSKQWARWLARLRDEWPHPLVFVLGSDLGLGEEVGAAARETVSLGRLTLSHELARLVLYEQIYRALCIDAGINYHRGAFSSG